MPPLPRFACTVPRAVTSDTVEVPPTMRPTAAPASSLVGTLMDRSSSVKLFTVAPSTRPNRPSASPSAEVVWVKDSPEMVAPLPSNVPLKGFPSAYPLPERAPVPMGVPLLARQVVGGSRQLDVLAFVRFAFVHAVAERLELCHVDDLVGVGLTSVAIREHRGSVRRDRIAARSCARAPKAARRQKPRQRVQGVVGRVGFLFGGVGRRIVRNRRSGRSRGPVKVGRVGGSGRLIAARAAFEVGIVPHGRRLRVRSPFGQGRLHALGRPRVVGSVPFPNTPGNRRAERHDKNPCKCNGQCLAAH